MPNGQVTILGGNLDELINKINMDVKEKCSKKVKEMRREGLRHAYNLAPESGEEATELSMGKITSGRRKGQIRGTPEGGRFKKTEGQKYIQQVIGEELRTEKPLEYIDEGKVIKIISHYGKISELNKTGYSWERRNGEILKTMAGWSSWRLFEYGGQMDIYMGSPQTYTIRPRPDRSILEPEIRLFAAEMEKTIKPKGMFRNSINILRSEPFSL